MAPDTATLVAAILNAAWMVRHYQRGAGSLIQRKERQAAIKAMGLTVRECFNQSEEFESLLAAVLDGLDPHKYEPRF